MFYPVSIARMSIKIYLVALYCALVLLSAGGGGQYKCIFVLYC